MNGHIVIDLTFGDSGKGITTDYLSSKLTQPIVVRFSGGQQAGHNVKIGDVSHIHSNYGSGTLRGVPSYFSEHCVVYPLTMFREKNVLETKGISPKLTIHPLAKVTTPGDVVYNRIRERKVQHGSCGLGVASTMQRNLNTGYKLYAIDLLNINIFWKKVLRILNYYTDILDIKDANQFNMEVEKELQYYYEAITSLKFDIQDYGYLEYFDNIIFEGSQGIMLDMDHGFFPNVTFANTTSKNAIEICNKICLPEISTNIYYVTRCYQTRHGKGAMTNETNIELINTQDEINKFNEWQKDFRIGEIDYNLLNHAISIDSIYSNGIYERNKGLVVTCLDQRPDFIFDYSKINKPLSYIAESYSADSKDFKICFDTWEKRFI